MEYKITYIGSDGGLKEAYASLDIKSLVLLLKVIKYTFGNKVLKVEEVLK